MSIKDMELARIVLNGLTAKDKAAIIREQTGAHAPVEPDRLLCIRAAADRLDKTPRTIFNLLKSGHLTRIKLPGRKRGAGVRNSELTALIEGGEK